MTSDEECDEIIGNRLIRQTNACFRIFVCQHEAEKIIQFGAAFFPLPDNY